MTSSMKNGGLLNINISEKRSQSLRLTGPTAMAEKVMPIAGNSLS